MSSHAAPQGSALALIPKTASLAASTDQIAMATAEASYAAEVASAKQRIKALKDRLARRAAARQGAANGRSGAAAGRAAGENDAAATAATEAVATLKRLIASHLLQLDVAQLPTDSQTIQKKVAFAHIAVPIYAAGQINKFFTASACLCS